MRWGWVMKWEVRRNGGGGVVGEMKEVQLLKNK